MSNTVAHLAVAQRIFALCPGSIGHEQAFYLGNLAPDTISSKPGCLRQDKLYAHLRNGISDIEWLYPEQMAIFDERKELFIARHLRNQVTGSAQHSFNLGYLAHLLTDKHNHSTLRQQVLRVARAQGLSERNGFFEMIIHDLDALDNYLLQSRSKTAELFSRLTSSPTGLSLEGYIESDYINASMIWWNKNYLPAIAVKTPRVLTPEDIDAFILGAADAVISELKEYSLI